RPQALEATRSGVGPALPRAGLPAGGDVQLAGADRLVARRPGAVLDRRDPRAVRPLGGAPLARPRRSRQARLDQPDLDQAAPARAPARRATPAAAARRGRRAGPAGPRRPAARA